MKIIKLAYIDFSSSINVEDWFLTKIFKLFGDVKIVNPEEADYVVFSVFGNSHWTISDDQIKIFYTGENLAPDYNTCDYAIGFEWMEYGDRYLRLPLAYTYDGLMQAVETKHILPESFSINKDKKSFCSFTVSNGRANSFREQLFTQLSNYKKVDSGGHYLNNIGYIVKDKYSFDLKHKFSIACENSSHPGYTTEKIAQAFAAHTIPIYWGDPDIYKMFNPKSFINANEFSSISDLIEYIKYLDNNDDAYLAKLIEPAIINDIYLYNNMYDRVAKFVNNIISQPLENAKRRNREFHGRFYIQNQINLIQAANYHQSLWNHFKLEIYKLIHNKQNK